MEKLYLEHNNLSGLISSNIENLTSLQHFWVNHNLFSGVLPDELFALNNLIKLKVNKFEQELITINESNNDFLSMQHVHHVNLYHLML